MLLFENIKSIKYSPYGPGPQLFDLWVTMKDDKMQYTRVSVDTLCRICLYLGESCPEGASNDTIQKASEQNKKSNHL